MNCVSNRFPFKLPKEHEPYTPDIKQTEATSAIIEDVTNTTQLYETLKHIAHGLVHGYKYIYQVSPYDAALFAKLSTVILKKLLEKNNTQSIEVLSDNIGFTLAEVEDHVLFSHDDISCAFQQTNLNDICWCLIEDILRYPSVYPKNSLDLALEHVMLNAPDEEFDCTRNAVIYILFAPKKSTNADLRYAAVKHVFQYDERYGATSVERAMKIVLADTENCHIPLVMDAEEKLSNPDDFDEVEVKGALAFSLTCADCESSSKLKEATANHVFQDEPGYSDETVNLVATMMVRNIEGCQEISTIHAIEEILNFVDEYESLSIQSACVYVFYNREHFSDAYFIKAIEHLLANGEKYCEAITKKALAPLFKQTADAIGSSLKIAATEYIFNAGLLESDELIVSACEFIIGCPNNETTSALKLTSAQFIFQCDLDCSNQLIVDCAMMMITLSQEGENISIVEAAKHILVSGEYPLLFTQSACFYIRYSPNLFSNEYIEKAYQHMLENITDYSECIFTHDAIQVIHNNFNFFTAPLRNPLAFSIFFDEVRDVIIEYSNGLTAVLTENRQTDHDGKTIYPDLDLWKAGEFKAALQANKNISIYIHTHAEHQAIDLYNFYHNTSTIDRSKNKVTGLEFYPIKPKTKPLDIK